MDKINRALSGVDDALTRIDGVERSLRASIAARTNPTVATGSSTRFGVYKAERAAVIVMFEGAACALTFGGNVVASGASPLVAVISGRGELALSAARSAARALVIGAEKED